MNNLPKGTPHRQVRNKVTYLLTTLDNTEDDRDLLESVVDRLAEIYPEAVLDALAIEIERRDDAEHTDRPKSYPIIPGSLHSVELALRDMLGRRRSARRYSTKSLKEACPKCGAPVNQQCTYTSDYNMHKDPKTGVYVWNVIGEPMLRNHYERGR